MSVLLGVIFFMLIQAGIRHGYKKGFSIAAGVITGDLLFVILAIGFTAAISEFLKSHDGKVALAGGMLLMIMGVASLFKKREPVQLDKPVSRLSNARDFYFKPLIINLLNPANAAWWLGLYSVPPALNYALDQKIVFAAGALGTVFWTEVGVAAAASGLKKFISPKTLKRVDTVVGIVLIIIGLRLLQKAAGLD